MNAATVPTKSSDHPAARPRRYEVVAQSFPIVYSLEGDHDPNGMLYTLRVHKPLLDWARARWDENDEYLPRMHRRRQLMEVVVDGIPRWREMRRRLETGPARDRYLLWELGDEDEVLDRERRDGERPRRSPRDQTVRQNYRATLDSLVSALRELTGGRVRRLTEDDDVLDEWHRQWTSQLISAEQGIEQQLQRVDAQFSDFLKSFRQVPSSGKLSAKLVRRLLLNDHKKDVTALADKAPPFDRFNPLRPIPLVRPLVLRACHGETVEVEFQNGIRGREVGLHVQGDGIGGRAQGRNGAGVRFGDGAQVGENRPTTVPYSKRMLYRWRCTREGVWPINDLADVRGTDRGTNNHGLFGALVVEPRGARWYDPETGERLDDTNRGDGLYADVVPPGEQPLKEGKETPALTCPPDADHACRSGNRCRRWREENFVDFHHAKDDTQRWAGNCSFREFTVFFHDEAETHSGIPHPLPHSAMPLSYRAEPMHNRLPYRLHRRHRRGSPSPGRDPNGIDHAAVGIELDDTLGEIFRIAQDLDGNYLEQVSGEEQHHSSWLFGEPVTPVLRAYRGDPCRVQLVHSGVKETHVFHLHVHQWRAVPQDTAEPSVWEPGAPHGSQLLDSISIGPQTGMTIDPLYGSGSRQHAVGDIIWHCHLYPHFHHGMWGLWRSYDRLVDGGRAYPDGTPCPPLVPLPGRAPDPSTEQRPGFPWFMGYSFPRKSPPPPSPRPRSPGDDVFVDGRRQRLRLPNCSDKEFDAFADGCRHGEQPGALFVDLDKLAQQWNEKADVPERRVVSYDIEMMSRSMTYNSAGWYDPHGHHYRLTGIRVAQLDDHGQRVGDPVVFDPPEVPGTGLVEPFFPRANHGDIVELRLMNTVGEVEADHFDLPAHAVECGLHVHLVKFDVLASDGSATGWNYLSGASSPAAVGGNEPGRSEKNVSLHRWVVDEEFGPCFFHDHLLANFRQKRGLFSALIAEPNGTRWCLPDRTTPAWTGSQAVVVPRDGGRPSGLDEPYREAGLALGDFVPLHRANGEPLNEPNLLGGDDDPGVMGVNYRCTPMEHRGEDPSEWFSSNRSSLDVDALRRRVFEDDDARRRAFGEETRGWPLDVGNTFPYLPVPRKGRGDPDTPVIYTYPGERLRIRMFQGSHEEQHSFMLNGMRWRKDWRNPRSPLVNQQTLGISEAFTVDVDPRRDSPYGIGDHLWQFTVMDDLWLGCWGLIRSMAPSIDNYRHHLLPLPIITKYAKGKTAAKSPKAPLWKL
ncbi:MAG: multicopper oxidase domain-containing protein, partial [Actinomycetota bacterium]